MGQGLQGQPGKAVSWEDKSNGSVHVPRRCWSFLLYIPTAKSCRKQMLLFLLHEKVFLTRRNRKIGHELVGVARVLPLIDTKGEMCRVKRRKLDENVNKIQEIYVTTEQK